MNHSIRSLIVHKLHESFVNERYVERTISLNKCFTEQISSLKILYEQLTKDTFERRISLNKQINKMINYNELIQNFTEVLNKKFGCIIDQ